MSANYLSAKLNSWRKINVVIFTDIPRPSQITVSIFKNNKLYKKENINKINSVYHLYFFEICLNEDYELGASYRLLLDALPMVNIDVSDVINFADFDER